MLEFLGLIKKLFSTFYSTWYKAIYNSRETSFIKLIARFEDATKPENGGSTDATFGGNHIDSSEPKKDNSNRGRPCLCGQPRSVYPRWINCKYCNEKIWKDSWTLDPKISKKVIEEAAKWKPLKDFI